MLKKEDNKACYRKIAAYLMLRKKILIVLKNSWTGGTIIDHELPLTGCFQAGMLLLQNIIFYMQ